MTIGLAAWAHFYYQNLTVMMFQTRNPKNSSIFRLELSINCFVWFGLCIYSARLGKLVVGRTGANPLSLSQFYYKQGPQTTFQALSEPVIAMFWVFSLACLSVFEQYGCSIA
jgi:hypothetical protein